MDRLVVKNMLKFSFVSLFYGFRALARSEQYLHVEDTNPYNCPVPDRHRIVRNTYSALRLNCRLSKMRASITKALRIINVDER